MTEATLRTEVPLDDEPLTTSPTAKKRRMPAWAIPAIGGIFIVIVLALVLSLVLGRKKPEQVTEAADEPIVQQSATTPTQPIGQSGVVAAPSAQQQTPTPPTQTGTPPQAAIGTAIDAGPTTQGPAAAAQPIIELASPRPAPIVYREAPETKRELAALNARVQNLEIDINRIITALTGQPAQTRAIIGDRVKRAKVASKPAQPSPSLAVRYNTNYAISMIAGDRAWLRSTADNMGQEINVVAGDYINGERVVEVNARENYLVLDKGERIK
jgi:hypothetical protein